MSRAAGPARSSITPNGVKIVGHLNVPSRIAVDASQLYARNLLAFLALLVDKDRQLQIDTSDEIIKAALLTRDGAVVNPALAPPAPADAVDSDMADGEAMAEPASLAERAGELAGDAGGLAAATSSCWRSNWRRAQPHAGGRRRHAFRLRADRVRARGVRRLLRRVAGDARRCIRR